LVEADSIEGVNVTFTSPTATDDNGTPLVRCDPSSGDFFRIGVTPVTCNAEDTVSGERSESISFSVRVLPQPKERAVNGVVRANLSYTKITDQFGIQTFKDMRLAIIRDGRLVYYAVVQRYPHTNYDVAPGRYGTRNSIAVRDLDGDGEPEVILDLYWGGAHCCAWSDIYSYKATTGTYTLQVHFWADVPYRFSDLNHDGRPEFNSVDTRFAYVFTDFADSFFPVQMWTYTNGKLADVTRRFPALIKRDARELWRTYLRRRNRHGDDVRGVLAAYVAVSYLVNRQALAWRQLHAAFIRGDLDYRIGFYGAAFGEKYLTKLRHFLRTTGYIR
jgi:HYR domain